MKIRNALIAIVSFLAFGVAQAECNWHRLTKLDVDGQGRTAWVQLCNGNEVPGSAYWAEPPNPPRRIVVDVLPPSQFDPPRVIYVPTPVWTPPPPVVYVPPQPVVVPVPPEYRHDHRHHGRHPHGWIQFDTRNISVRVPIR